MEHLVNLVKAKAGLNDEQAKLAVQAVMDHLKSKFPTILHHELDKIAEGAGNTFIKENTLLTQPFVKDGSKTVADYLKESGDVKVTEFKRVALG